MSSLIPDEERDVPFLSKQHSHYYFDAKIAAAATVDCTSAEEPVVVFETSDESYEKTSRGEYVPLETFNAVTGPVFVRGADVGDALVVTVLDIRIVRTWVVALPGYGGLGNFVEQDIKEQVVKELVLEEYLSESDDTKARPRTRVWLSDRLGVDVRPMIGCIGVAPAKGTCSTLAPIFPTGEIWTSMNSPSAPRSFSRSRSQEACSRWATSTAAWAKANPAQWPWRLLLWSP